MGDQLELYKNQYEIDVRNYVLSTKNSFRCSGNCSGIRFLVDDSLIIKNRQTALQQLYSHNFLRKVIAYVRLLIRFSIMML